MQGFQLPLALTTQERRHLSSICGNVKSLAPVACLGPVLLPTRGTPERLCPAKRCHVSAESSHPPEALQAPATCTRVLHGTEECAREGTRASRRVEPLLRPGFCMLSARSRAQGGLVAAQFE